MIIIFVLPALAAKERPLVIGPSMNVRTDWLTNFLDALGSTKILDVISYHMYPGYGRSLDLPHLIPTPAWLDFPHSVASQVKSAVAMSSRGVDLLNGGLELWIDETAAAWASGKLWLTSRLLSMVYAYTYRTTPAFSSRLLSMVYAYTYRTTPAFCYHLFTTRPHAHRHGWCMQWLSLWVLVVGSACCDGEQGSQRNVPPMPCGRQLFPH